VKFDLRRIRIHDFIKEMDLAYAAADVVVSRSGAIAVSEICIAKKPVILVPSPNVAEDHQTKNAKALVDKGAAVLVSDRDASIRLVDEALKLLFDGQRAAKLIENIAGLARPDATIAIVNEIDKLLMERSADPDLPAKDTSRYVLDKSHYDRKLDVGGLQPVLVKS
jgi:UDP-N-acetylglucosamine--N-acetylmuramyl-(pentapeptide) pyrophosphoryl-undecaprenol N-acetylglucosamine transferase